MKSKHEKGYYEGVFNLYSKGLHIDENPELLGRLTRLGKVFDYAIIHDVLSYEVAILDHILIKLPDLKDYFGAFDDKAIMQVYWRERYFKGPTAYLDEIVRLRIEVCRKPCRQ